MLSVEKVATPATAATVVVPESVPGPGFTSIVSATFDVKLVTVFARESCAVTTTGGSATPATDVCGCAVNASWTTGAGTISNALLTDPVSPLERAESV